MPLSVFMSERVKMPHFVFMSELAKMPLLVFMSEIKMILHCHFFFCFYCALKLHYSPSVS